MKPVIINIENLNVSVPVTEIVKSDITRLEFELSEILDSLGDEEKKDGETKTFQTDSDEEGETKTFTAKYAKSKTVKASEPKSRASIKSNPR